jgi:hypothetical protein
LLSRRASEFEWDLGNARDDARDLRFAIKHRQRLAPPDPTPVLTEVRLEICCFICS